MASTSNAFRGRRRRQRTAELGEGFWGVADGFRPPAGVSDSRADETPIPRRGLQHLQSSEFWSHFSFLLRAGGSSWWQRWMHVRTTVQLAGEFTGHSETALPDGWAAVHAAWAQDSFLAVPGRTRGVIPGVRPSTLT